MEYRIIRSKRKTVSLEINRYGEVLVRAPMKLSEKFIEDFVKKHEKWIEKHKADFAETKRYEPSEEEIQKLIFEAKEKLPVLVEYYGGIMDVKPEKITITRAKTRFGSCSGKNRICFSCFLMNYPQEAIEYVVVHELAHIKYHNHKKEFYDFIAEFLPDYKSRIRLLKK